MEKYKWVLIRAGLVLFSLLVGVNIHQDKALSIYQIRQQVVKFGHKLNEARSWKVVTSRLQTEITTLGNNLHALEKITPETQVQSGILGYIQTCSKSANLILARLQPESPVRFPQYDQTRIELQLKGKYHNVGRFINLLENSEAVINVESLQLSTRDMLTGELTAEMRLSVFQMR